MIPIVLAQGFNTSLMRPWNDVLTSFGLAAQIDYRPDAQCSDFLKIG